MIPLARVETFVEYRTSVVGRGVWSFGIGYMAGTLQASAACIHVDDRWHLTLSLFFTLRSGKCVITLNTPLAAAPFGLIANHSYAVLGKHEKIPSPCCIPCLFVTSPGLTIERERRFISVLNSLYAETRSTPGACIKTPCRVVGTCFEC